jgi:hypothetical protein
VVSTTKRPVLWDRLYCNVNMAGFTGCVETASCFLSFDGSLDTYDWLGPL